MVASRTRMRSGDERQPRWRCSTNLGGRNWSARFEAERAMSTSDSTVASCAACTHTTREATHVIPQAGTCREEEESSHVEMPLWP